MTPTGQPQHTLASAVHLSGVGVHSGRSVELTAQPAEADTGIRFVRCDLTDRPVLKAAAANLDRRRTSRQTCLVDEGGVRVETVEHLLAACLAMGVDNARIELTGPELPILDGSARLYAEAFERVGLKPQQAPRRRWTLRRPVILQHEKAELTALPAETMRISYFARLHQVDMENQALHIELDPTSFVRDVAPARTFVFYQDLPDLLRAGMIRGGSFDCALIIRNGQPCQGDGTTGDALPLSEADIEQLEKKLRPCQYRVRQELAAHKLLDLVGDLGLLGQPVNALFTARASGHALHHKFIDLLRKELLE